MVKYKILVLSIAFFLLVSCHGRSVRSVLQNEIELSAGEIGDEVQMASNQISSEVENGEVGVAYTAKESETESPVMTVTEINPLLQSENTLDGTQQSGDSQTDSEATTVNSILLIESHNAYTDAEKEALLKEIDFLLDETLKGLTEDVFKDLDLIEEGGQ